MVVVVGVHIRGHLSLVLLSGCVFFIQVIWAPKRGITINFLFRIFLVEERSSGSDQWVWMFLLGLGPAKITLWAPPSWQSPQARVTSVNYFSSLRSSKEEKWKFFSDILMLEKSEVNVFRIVKCLVTALCCYPNVKWEIRDFHLSTHFLAV